METSFKYGECEASPIRGFWIALNYWLAGGALLLLSQRILLIFGLISAPLRRTWWTFFSILAIYVLLALVAETLRKILKRFTHWTLAPTMFHIAVCIGYILFRTSFLSINQAWPVDNKVFLGYLNIFFFSTSILIAIMLAIIAKDARFRSGRPLLFLWVSIVLLPGSLIIFPINRQAFYDGFLNFLMKVNLGLILGAMFIAFLILLGGVVLIRWMVSTLFQTRRWLSSPILASAVPIAMLVLFEAVFLINVPMRTKEDHILFVLIDCLRADHVGCYGYSRNTTPKIDELARKSIIFKNAFSQTNWTKPSVASYFTSLYVSQHGVFKGGIMGEKEVTGDVLDEKFETIPEAMKKAGYNTGAFLSHGQIEDYLGFAQGFDIYQNHLGRASDINRTYFEWLDRQSGSTFAYLHYIDLHEPYLPIPPFDRFAQFNSMVHEEIKTDFLIFRKRVNEGLLKLNIEDLNQLKALYDGEVAYCDAQVGKLINGLKKRGIYSKTLILVTADHGESFLEHGKMSHAGRNLYDELIHVPLIMKLPGEVFGNKVIDETVRLIDLFPTLCEHVDQKVPLQCKGKSLLPLILGEEDTERIAFAETEETICARSVKGKLICDRNTTNKEFYNIATDHSEVYNRANLISNEYQRLNRLLEIWKQDAKLLFPEKDRTLKLKEETVKKLKSLGYLDY